MENAIEVLKNVGIPANATHMDDLNMLIATAFSENLRISKTQRVICLITRDIVTDNFRG